MPVIQKHKEGHPCWADLNSIDAELTKKFYTDLFGWDADGTLVWFELTTDDRIAAETFYKKVLMVDSMTMSMEKDEDYMVLGGEQNPIGGILAKTPAMGEGIPNYWGIYFRTDTLDESIKRAAELGAEIVLPRTSLGEQGYMAVLKDPTGAHFSLHMSKSSG